MAKYAHVKDGQIYRIKELTDSEIADIPPHKAAYLLPYIEVASPTYDSATHHPPVKQPDDIQANQVTQVWAAPVAKTQQEIDDETNAKLDDAIARIDRQYDITKGLAMTLFEAVNQIRDLQSQPNLTLQQFKDYVRGKL